MRREGAGSDSVIGWRPPLLAVAAAAEGVQGIVLIHVTSPQSSLSWSASTASPPSGPHRAAASGFSAAAAAAAAASLLASACLAAPAAANPSTAFLIPAVAMEVDNATSFDEQVLLFTFQGIANRASPLVWLYVTSTLFWSGPESTFYFAESYLGPVKHFAFTNATGGFCDLYARAAALSPGGASPVAGLALFDADEHDATRWLAVTQSGLDDLLPVSAATLAAHSECLGPLPVRADFRRRFPSDLAAYDWALDNLMPRCNRSIVYSAGHSYTDLDGSVNIGGDPSIIIGLDMPVSLRSFVFNLSPDTANQAAQAAEWGRLVATRDPGRLVFGWAEPEPDMTASTSKAGGAVVCDAAPNLSFWTHVASAAPVLPYNSMMKAAAAPEGAAAAAAAVEGEAGTAGGSSGVGSGNVGAGVGARAGTGTGTGTRAGAGAGAGAGAVQAPTSRQAALDKSSYYVTFQTNEGDTPKILAALEQGVWTDPRRGSVPIAWGMDPLISLYAPGLLEYYSLTSTANDSWLAATAGAGYAYPWMYNATDLQLYVGRAAALAESLAPASAGWPEQAWAIDIWDDNNLTQLEVYNSAWKAASAAANAGSAAAQGGVGIFTMQPESMAGTNSWLSDGTPVVITEHALWYPCENANASTLDGMEATIRGVMAAHPSPWFFVVYGCILSPSADPVAGRPLNIIDFALGMRDRLGPAAGGPLQVVGMQDLARLAREAGQDPEVRARARAAGAAAAAREKGLPRIRRTRPVWAAAAAGAAAAGAV